MGTELLFGSLPDLFAGVDTDFISDRCNHIWVVAVFAVFAALIGIHEFVGDPIDCWCPAQFTETQCNYTEAYCWIQSNYYIPTDDPIPFNNENRYDHQIQYYPWVPIILLFLASCFKAPNVLWNMCNGVSGIGVRKLIRLADEATLDTENNDNCKHVAEYIYRWLTVTRIPKRRPFNKITEQLAPFMFFCLGIHNNSYITGFYVFIKLLYFAVTVGIFCLLNKLLALEYTLYGFEVMGSLIKGTELAESPYFPRITLCDFHIRQLQNVHTYTVQCVLSMNLFIEKIFIFSWFLLFLMMIFNAICWILAIKDHSFPCSRIKWLQHRLDMKLEENSEPINDTSEMLKFVRFLGCDSIFVLRLIEKNTSPVASIELIHELRNLFLNRQA